MTARTIQLDITILGREFKVACKENEREELSEAVASAAHRYTDPANPRLLPPSEMLPPLA